MAKGKGAILVTGARGQQGGAVAGELLARKHTVRAMTRTPDSDFGRMGRQQQVISAILARISSPAGALRLPATIGALQKSTDTDVQAPDFASLGPAAFNLSGDHVHRLMIA